MSKILCIYHGNCADGFGAAWAVRQCFGDADVEFHPGIYGNDPPDVRGRDCQEARRRRASQCQRLSDAARVGGRRARIDDLRLVGGQGAHGNYLGEGAA